MAYSEWNKTYQAWRADNAELAREIDEALSGKTPDLLQAIPAFDPASNIATRKAGSDVLQSIAAAMPLVTSGSADLHGSTLNYIKDGGDFNRENHAGRNLHFGIREHAMCGIMNGMAYDGIFRASGATFLVFSDYGRPSIRVAALSHLPTVYIFTHDSVGVGEDVPVETRRQGVFKGGYIAKKETSPLELILLASGSELQHAMKAASALGSGTRVVSLPCFERFESQSAEYKESVLPKACRKRISIEAGISDPWFRYVGLDGKVLGIDRFGLSAPGNIVMEQLGITAAHIVEAAKTL